MLDLEEEVKHDALSEVDHSVGKKTERDKVAVPLLQKANQSPPCLKVAGSNLRCRAANPAKKEPSARNSESHSSERTSLNLRVKRISLATETICIDPPHLAPGTTNGIPTKSGSPSSLTTSFIARAKIPGCSFLSRTHSASHPVGSVSTSKPKCGRSLAIRS